MTPELITTAPAGARDTTGQPGGGSGRPAIRTSGLVKRFETTTAVDHVDLVVAEGEVRGLLGPNGAGKTTLLRMLFGLVRPDGGTIEICGRALSAPDAVELDGVAGFVEEPRFYPYLSGRANLELLAELDGDRGGARIDDALEHVGLAARAGDRVSGYSTGMRQRLGIAASLLRSPRLLLLDEPTSGLDPAGVRDIGELVRGLSRSGVTILLSSHQIGEIEDVCDSFTVLRQGRVVWDDTAAQLRAQAPPSAYWLTTNDDREASLIARDQPGVHVSWPSQGRLTVTAGDSDLDGLVFAMAAQGVAVRRLELIVSPLESLFFSLTNEAPEENGASSALGEAGT